MGIKSDKFGIVETRFQPTMNSRAIVNRLMREGKDFVFRETNYMTQIIYDGVETIYRSKDKESFPANKLFIFKMVQADAKKFLKNNPEWSVPAKYPVNATNYNFDDSYGEITGTDINSAYWTIARNMGIISENTYEKASGSDWKVIRLAALAVLGRNTAYQEYKAGIKQKDPIVIESPDSRIRLLYRGIRYNCYAMMNELAEILDKDFEAYRTDCIYYRDSQENRQKVYEYLDEQGFTYKQLIYEEE